MATLTINDFNTARLAHEAAIMPSQTVTVFNAVLYGELTTANKKRFKTASDYENERIFTALYVDY